MPTRSETAAATRRALLDAASTLLDAGGPEEVTLREVGARAGVSRSAPYRHFANKESLLTELATQAWNEVGDSLQALVSSPGLAPDARLRRALSALMAVGRFRPHLYQLMFAAPAADPTALVRAAERTNELFLGIVAEIVGPAQARPHAALLLASVQGLVNLELSGHLASEKWQQDADDLIDLQITLLPDAA